MRTSLTMFSFVALVAAIVAWVGVWFLFSDISTRLTARAEALSTNNVQSSQQQTAIAVHALVADTTSQRAQLDAEVAADVVGIAGEINDAGKAAGVTTTIGSASVIGTSASSDTSELQFLVQATGSFAEVWRAAQLFQTLPLVSRVEELDFEASPNSGKTQWQLTARIDVLTSAQVSS